MDERPRTVLATVIAAAGAVAVAAAVHIYAGTRVPAPWSDESHFLISARALLLRSSFRVPELDQPKGIFWMADGYPLIVAAWWRLTGTLSLDSARWLSFVATAAAAGAFFSAAKRRMGLVVAGAASVAWLLSPHTVFVGNFARMEALVLAVVAAAFALAARRRTTGAAGALLLGAVIHPAALFFLVAFVAAVGRDVTKARNRWELGLVVVATVAVSAQVAWWLVNVDAASSHIAAQLQTKSTLRIRAVAGAFPLGIATAAAVAMLAGKFRHDPLARIALALAAAGGVVTAIGRDLAYDVYGYETALFLVFVAVGPAVASVLRGRWIALAGFVAAVHLVLPYASQLIDDRPQPISHYRLYGMSPLDGGADEWDDFVGRAADEVERLANADQAHVTVVVPAISPGGFELLNRQIEGVAVVHETKLQRAYGDFTAVFLARYLTGGDRPPPPPASARYQAYSQDGNYSFWIEAR